MVAGLARRDPNRDPTSPPTMALGAQTARAVAGIADRVLSCPASPDRELSRMKAALTPAVVLVAAQRLSSSTGLRNTPPPMPVIPASSPIPPPTASAGPIGGRSAGSSTGRVVGRRSWAAESSRTSASTGLYTSPGSTSRPPRKANGTAEIANGHRTRQENAPRRAKATSVMLDTATLSTSAAGRITLGAIENSAITAK